MTLRIIAWAALACLVLGGAPARADIASFYASGYRTASCERFRPDGMTTAHRSLPFGTRVQVICAATGRPVVVHINDRGPFIAGRSIDLARGAARALGMIGAGTARVGLAVIR